MVDKTTEIDEAKASNDVDAMSADPTTGEGGEVKKRLADVKKQVDPKADEVEDDVKTPRGPNTTGVKGGTNESIESLFDGEDLSEDFKVKTTAIFEAAVSERVEEQRAAIREEIEAEMATSLQEATDELTEKLDSYLDYVVEQWLESNEVALEKSITVEVAESLINSLKDVVVEHNLNITDEEVDAVAELEQRLTEMEEKYNGVVNTLTEEKNARNKLEREISFAVISEDLTDTQAEKLKGLSEGLSYSDLNEYETKLKIVKEKYFTESLVKDKGPELEELVEDKTNPTAKPTNPGVARYADAISRQLAK